jgi:hypothetical protein
MFVAALILVSTTGFTINLHYCHNQLVDLALFSPAKSCCDTAKEEPCDAQHSISKKSHCENESIVVESTENFVGSSFEFSFNNNHSIDLLLTALIIFNDHGIHKQIVKEPPWHKEPPPYQEVVLSQIQSFLI